MTSIINFSLFIFFALISLASAQVYQSRSHPVETTTIIYSPYPTSVWATGTVGGLQTVTKSVFTQKFTPMYSTVAVPKSGSIGLGTHSGTVGTVKPIKYMTYSEYTTRVS